MHYIICTTLHVHYKKFGTGRIEIVLDVVIRQDIFIMLCCGWCISICHITHHNVTSQGILMCYILFDKDSVQRKYYYFQHE